jgi:hypothetical protein
MGKRILIIKRLVLANLKSPLTLEEFSAEPNASVSLPRHLIKEETGVLFG